MNILIIEDDLILAKNIFRTFTQFGFTNRIAHISSYDEFLHFRDSFHSFDIILLDINLGSQQNKGFDILQYLRNISHSIPIVMMSSYSDISFLQKSFTLGANDYLIKPFRIRELQVRIERWFRNYIFTEYYAVTKTLKYEHIIFDITKYEFYIGDKKIHLSTGNKYLFSLFMIYRERMLTYEFLREKIFGYASSDVQPNIRIKILRLKKQLNHTDIVSWIVTVRGEGYIFQKQN